MKNCQTCKQDKDESVFNKNVSKKDGLHGSCKECTRIHRKKWYGNSSEAQKKRVYERNKKFRKVVIQNLYDYLLKNPCARCGEKDPTVLEFDHLRDKFKAVGVMAASSYSWDTILKEIEKCQVLCANCHRLKTAEDQQWAMWKMYHLGVKLDSEQRDS